MTILSSANQVAINKMDKKRSWLLTAYLLIATVFTSYMVYSLWSARLGIIGGQNPGPKCSADAGPLLSNLYPDRVSVGSTLSDFLIIGCAFTSTTQVKFNGIQHAALFVDASHIRPALTSADVAAPGTVVVALSTGGADFGSAVLTIVPPEVDWHFLRVGRLTITLEAQLLLLVLFTGAFGSSIYALKSLADYEGDDKLYASWFTYYVIQPFEGAGVALLLYLVIRGGFLTGSSADLKAVNQFGVCAIAGLAGAFSDTAFLKLREVFLTLFKPKDDRGGKLTLEITTPILPDGTAGTSYKHSLQASRGTAPFIWSVTPALPAGLTLDASTGTVSGTPTAPTKSTYRFTVTDSATPSESCARDLTLEIKPAVSGLEIATTALPDGSSNTAYSARLEATGGTAPLNWTVTPVLPAGLTLDANTGSIRGTPTAAPQKTKLTFTVTDSAKPAASSTAELTLEIK